MSAVLSLLIIFGFLFLIIAVISDKISEVKTTRMKIEAALREEEMRKGYAPGTYSRAFASKSTYKEILKEEKRRKKKGYSTDEFQRSEESDREALENGIKDLESRIDNLDTILRERTGRKNK